MIGSFENNRTEVIMRYKRLEPWIDSVNIGFVQTISMVLSLSALVSCKSAKRTVNNFKASGDL